ncbi:phoenix [Amphiprion ocellaris]|uniref:phoenix n=1 Tax=Amphiprion ocellaris TaxID=80972 RepID=UPI000C313EEA|nr:phoenix [Amphiprion ocellaris]
MTQMSVTGTLSDLVTEAESSLTEPSVGQRDGAPAETDSDSGDSLFITQKPVPEAVRSGRRRRSSFRSDPPSLTDAEGSDDSASPEESKTDRKKTVKRIKLPKHSFSFLKQRRIGPIRIEELKIKQNTSLHSAVMGGFFKSVRDVWQSRQRKKKTSLPTVDMPKESILPISEEEEEEKPEDEDIRVVEKKRFVVSLKAKCSQSWCTSSQGDGQEKKQRGRRSMKARQETSQGGQQKMLAPKSRELLSTCTSSDEKEESSSRALVERKTSDKLVASNTSAAETPKTEKREENEDDSSASVCELSPNGPEASTEVAEPQEDVFLTDERPQTGQAECEPEGQNLLQTDANDDTMCSESRVKKKIEDRRGHEAVEEEEGQSQHDVSFTEVEETPSVSQTIAELVIHKIKAMESLSHDDNIITVEERDIPDPKKKKKKKKKKNKLAAEDVREEEDGPLESNVRVEEEDGVFSGSCNVENGGKEKKKSKKRNEDDELLKSNLQSEPLNGVAEKPKKKKKKKKDLTSEPAEQLQEVEDCLEEASQETGESSYVEGRKRKKKQKASSGDHFRGDDCIDVSFSNEVITGVSVKKKNTEEDENVDKAQNTTEGGEDHNAELLRILSEDSVAQSDDSVSVRKKKKKRTSSFLVADLEENAAQTYEETPSVAAYSWPADKPAGESAETTGSLEKADDGVGKKKKKRKKVSAEQEKAEKDFEEPDRTCQTAVAETDDEKKKKRRRDDSESVTSMEIVEKASDSQAAKQKKKKKKDIREIPSATAENNESEESKRNICVPLSHKKKSSTVAAKGINETCNDSRAANDQATLEAQAKQASPSSETPENQAGNDVRGKKKKQKVKAAESVLLEGKSFAETDEIKAPKPKKKDGTQPAAESSLSSVFSDSSLCQSETCSSHSGRKNKHKKAKHRHFNPIEDFITDG